MCSHPSLDREAFQKLLASAFAVQESNINSHALSVIMEVQRLLLNGQLDMNGAMQRIAESAQDVANATGVAIGLLKGSLLIYRAGSGTAVSYIGRKVAASLTASTGSNPNREILRVENAQTDTRIESDICRQFGAQSLLILPIYHAQDLAGVMQILFADVHRFDDLEVRTYRLMVRQIEAALLHNAQLEEKKDSNAKLPVLQPVEQPVERGSPHPVPVLNSTGYLAHPLSDHFVGWRWKSGVAAAKQWLRIEQLGVHATKTRQWLNIQQRTGQRTFAAAAVSAALLLIFLVALNMRRPLSSSGSALSRTSGVDSPGGSQVAESTSTKTPSLDQPAPDSAKGVRSSKLRRVRNRKNRGHKNNSEVEYIGNDVTVRYFTYKPAARKALTGESRVAHIGDDVTVRYFTPNPQ